MTPKPAPILDRALIESELLDAKAQRDAAQQKLNESQALAQQAQQNANAAQAMIFTSSGAIQQNEAYLKKLDDSADKQTSAT